MPRNVPRDKSSFKFLVDRHRNTLSVSWKELAGCQKYFLLYNVTTLTIPKILQVATVKPQTSLNFFKGHVLKVDM